MLLINGRKRLNMRYLYDLVLRELEIKNNWSR